MDYLLHWILDVRLKRQTKQLKENTNTFDNEKFLPVEVH